MPWQKIQRQKNFLERDDTQRETKKQRKGKRHIEGEKIHREGKRQTVPNKQMYNKRQTDRERDREKEREIENFKNRKKCTDWQKPKLT